MGYDSLNVGGAGNWFTADLTGTNWLLRQVLHKYVPKQLVERPKMGFAVPVGEWLRGPLREWAEALLSSSRLRSEGYLDVRLVRDAWEQHLTGRVEQQPLLWNVLMFQAWLDRERS